MITILKTTIALAAWLANAVALAANPAHEEAPLRSAVAHLAPLGSGHVGGMVELIERADTLQVRARLTGLAPGLHAFHLHQHGDCTSAAATGGHYEPALGTDAGARSEHHGGEFGAVFADKQGRASLNLLLTGISLAPGGARRSIAGRSIVVHSAPDDFIAWPAPTKGRTLACGVIDPA
jgi:Cu-Zn family superoxide dismutase